VTARTAEHSAAIARHVRALETLLGRRIVTVVFQEADGGVGLAIPGEADDAYVGHVLAWIGEYGPPTPEST